MTSAVAVLFERYERFSEAEKAEFYGAFIRRFGSNDIFGEITEEYTEEMGRQSFQRLDEEEQNASKRGQ